jgi:DNA end-binding protein Ku
MTDRAHFVDLVRARREQLHLSYQSLAAATVHEMPAPKKKAAAKKAPAKKTAAGKKTAAKKATRKRAS